MPTFVVQLPNLVQLGPVVDVMIVPGRAAAEAMQRSGEMLPKPVQVVALIDTGATGTVLQTGVAASLNLKPVGRVQITTASSAGLECPEFSVQLLFPAARVAVEVAAIEAPMQGQPVQMLIGRDVLAGAVLVYNGVASHYSLSF